MGSYGSYAFDLAARYLAWKFEQPQKIYLEKWKGNGWKVSCICLQVDSRCQGCFEFDMSKKVVHQQLHKAAIFPKAGNGGQRVAIVTQVRRQRSTEDLNASVY